MCKHSANRAFTIVELLVVIVVIGILASVILIAYNGVSGRARNASLSSDLALAKKQIENFYAVNGYYPTANNCTNTTATEICLKASTGNTITYVPNTTSSPSSYSLLGKNSATNYATSLDPLLNGLVGWYRMMGNANDSSGNGNNGTLFNSPSLVADKYGNANSAYSFVSTSSQYIALTQTSGLPIYGGGKAYSICTWINAGTQSSGTWTTFYGEGTSVDWAPMMYTGIYNSQKFNIFNYGLNGTTSILSNARSTTTIADNTWHHICFSDPGTGLAKFYVDGNLDATNFSYNSSNYAGFETSMPLSTIAGLRRKGGGLEAGSRLDGSLFDFRLYNRALSASEVQLLSTATSRF